MNPMSAYDTIASGFERDRALPGGVPQAVRDLVLAGPGRVDRPRILDLGAGTGRFGWPFVAAADDYVGADLSAGMLRVFAGRFVGRQSPLLAQADGRALPFADACFDVVLLIAVFGDVPDWRPLVDEARRVLRPGGEIVMGRIAMPDDGIDARMKGHLEAFLEQRMPRVPSKHGRWQAAQHLAATAYATTDRVAASWRVERRPREFLARHSGAARFSRLPLATREDALHALAGWAQAQFGSLDAVFAEVHRFEMHSFRFKEK